MDIRDLEYLAVSADAENFGRSAEALGVNVSTVSRRISRMEDELGLALFERNHSGVRLTSGGRAVMLHVRRALAEVEALKRFGIQAGSGLDGEVRLGILMAPVGDTLAGLLEAWRVRHPGVTLTVTEMADGNLAGAVTARRLDVVVAPHHAVGPRDASTPLYPEKLLAVLPERHPAANRKTLKWVHLRHDTILIQDTGNIQAARDFYASVLGAGVLIRPHSASKESMFALVRAGFGIAFTNGSQTDPICPGVVLKPIDEPDASVMIMLAWDAELEDPVVGRFVARLRDEARSRRLC